MPSCIARAACLAILLAAGAARAGDLADFNAAVENAESHNRVAIGYLRTGNVDLASIELDRLREAWAKLTERFNGKRPEMFDGNTYYVVAMTDIATRLVTADLMLHSSHPDVTRQSLLAVRNDLYKLRKSAGIVVLSDCIYDANNAIDALMFYNDRDLDWTKPNTRFGVASKAAIYDSELNRCDDMAELSLRKNPEFRRLIDGAKAGLALIPKAIATRDSDLLHRVLIELRSFDNLLSFRFG
ncbi:MAG: hypothetical protein ACREB2_14090 [Pseudolabrys sp.]